MLYTSVIMSRFGKITVKYIDASHDWTVAWETCLEKVESANTLVTIIPGKHEIITASGRQGYSYV
jgi:hypothetical protein